LDRAEKIKPLIPMRARQNIGTNPTVEKVIFEMVYSVPIAVPFQVLVYVTPESVEQIAIYNGDIDIRDIEIKRLPAPFWLKAEADIRRANYAKAVRLQAPFFFEESKRRSTPFGSSTQVSMVCKCVL
jgi:hypothetical protein